MNPKVYVICGVHNNLKFTKALIEYLKSQTYKPIEIVIINDGSTDETATFLKKQKYITTIEGYGNLWWTGSVQRGVIHVLSKCNDEDFILTINNDCQFDSGYIRNIVQTATKYKNTIVGSLAINAKDRKTIIDAGVQIDWAEARFVKIGPAAISAIPTGKDIEFNIDTLSTKGTLIPVEVIKKVGNFNTKIFPHYLSDYEFACRAKKMGFGLVVSYKSRVFNYAENTGIGFTLTQKLRLMEAFRLLFSRKSRVNIVDSINFINLYCPRRYKLINFVSLAKKIILGSKMIEWKI